MQLGNKIIDIPIIQGGMGVGVSLSGLAGAVAGCGGIGVISSVNAGYKENLFSYNPFEANIKVLTEEIKRAKAIAKGKGMIAVNIMTAVSHYEENCIAAIKAGADAIISGAGIPLKLPEFTKGTNTLCIPIVSSVRAAKLIVKNYMKKYQILPDMFVIEGNEAGGHLGFEKNEIIEHKAKANDEILDEMLEFTREVEIEHGKKIPLCVAGGVFSGSDMAHFLGKGADAVQIATRFIATNECDADIRFKEVIVNAKKEDIVIIDSPVGMPARAINTPLIKRLKEGESFRAKKCNNCLTACKKNDEIPYCISRALIEAVKGNVSDGLFFSGSNAYRINKIVSVKELMDEIMTEYKEAII